MSSPVWFMVMSILPARARLERYLPVLAVAGASVAAGQVLWWFSIGAWPPHDSVNIWLAGARLLEGADVYTGLVAEFLVFVYAPPVAVLAGPWSLLPVEVLIVVLLAAQVVGFRWVAGSWMAVGLLCWLPIVPRALVTGNVDFVMAAAIYAGARGLRGSGWAASLFAFMKFSPALAVRRWREFVVATIVLVAITLPWPSLWPAWVATIIASVGVATETLPILPRIPIVLVLLLVRRPWSIAAAAALATPAFYFHSWVLLFPAARLWLADTRRTFRPHR